MKILRAVFPATIVLLTVAALAAYFGTRTSSAPISSPLPPTNLVAAPPVEGWKSVATRSFAMVPEAKAKWDLPFKGKLRIAVRSEAPVAFKLDIGGCEATEVLEAIEECNIASTPPATLLLRDTRDPGFSLGKALIGMKSKNEKLSNSIATTRTTVELFRRGCIANCPPAGQR